MAYTAIHPHKGYLNSLFKIYTDSKSPQTYVVCEKSDGSVRMPIVQGTINSNEPHEFKVTKPGLYTVHFEDETDIDIVVEDGYKFGGGNYKSSFIDDVSPWVFIVMHDRTYFYNRDTEESYLETISPDEIKYVSESYVLFSNESDDIQTLYSLESQRPILSLRNIVCYNHEYIVWEVENTLNIYSLLNQKKIREVSVQHYTTNNDYTSIFYINNKNLYRLDLGNDCNELQLLQLSGDFVTFVESRLAISYLNLFSTGTVYIYDLISNESSELPVEGVLAKINNVDLVDVWKQRQGICNFKIDSSEFSEATIQALYVELIFFPCPWDIFYTTKKTSIFKSSHRFNVSEENSISSLIKKVNKSLNSNIGRAIVSDSNFCFYNSSESYVCGKIYSGSGYTKGGRVNFHKGIVKLTVNTQVNESITYTLSNNGYWDNGSSLDYDYTHFEKFGIVKDKSSSVYKNLRGEEFGNHCSYFAEGDFLQFSNVRIYAGGKVFSLQNHPTKLSPSFKYGIKINKENNSLSKTSIELCVLSGEQYEMKSILQSEFDTSSYKDVLFSECGEYVMYNDGNETTVMNIHSGQVHSFGSMSYIKHINGTRPLFETPSSLQPRLIHPYTRQYIDSKSMPEYQFVSPDGKLYADTRLNEYIEYYYKETGELISKENYKQLVSMYSYPFGEKKDSAAYKAVIESRKKLVLDNFEYLNLSYPRLLHDDRNSIKWDKSVLDIDDQYGTTLFLSRLINQRGIAIIRDLDTENEVARISLGAPLSFINYVSFSYDSRYVALAGYRNFSNGLFLIYDLLTKEEKYSKQPQRAVWSTAFSSQGSVAAYSSVPCTFYAINSDGYDECSEIASRNFLTYSPDGEYIALSCQGYTSKYDKDGNPRDVWGHQPSSRVFIKSINDIDNDLAEFNDLSDCGVADSFIKNSVASVSFSCDNSKLMMVGKDGVVVIRNLKLRKSITDQISDLAKDRVLSREKMTQEELDTIQSATITEHPGELRSLDILTKDGANLSGDLSPKCSYPSGKLDLSKVTIYLTKMQSKDDDILCRWIVE